jgi:Ca2+-binding RTX toxin-like protein
MPATGRRTAATPTTAPSRRSTSLFGDLGNDTLVGGLGNDILDGGAGIDKAEYKGVTAAAADGWGIRADFEANTVTGADGQDALRGVEDINGTQFADHIFGNDTANVIGGGPGDDEIRGRGAADRLYGALGNDWLIGDEGAERLYGGDGADSLHGLDDDDLLEGYTGNDYLKGGGGNDVLKGGADADTVGFSESDNEYYVDEPGGRDIIADFVKGEDDLYFNIYADEYFQYFSDFDSNGNGVLDNADDYVRVENATYGGVTRQSTVITWGTNISGGEDSAVVYGVTGLTANDFETG